MTDDHIYRCFETERHLDTGELKVESCRSIHKSLAAAEKHAKSEFYPYLSSNQPYEQGKLEIIDEAGKVHALFHKEIRGRRGMYAKWVKQEQAAEPTCSESPKP